MPKILIIGKSGRIDCITDALANSNRNKELFGFSEVMNPGLLDKCVHLNIGKTHDIGHVIQYATLVQPDFAIIGPEEPLEAGVVDALEKIGIPSVGPKQALAQLESSKSFTRELLSRNNIPGNPEFRVFKNFDGLEAYLRELKEFVVKPDGLTAGKGVKVFGEHLFSIDDALQYCQELLNINSVVIEEKIDGEEFSLQSFCDGTNVVHTIPVQDHKRAFNGDEGPNTGGMGSYSCENHSLPFLQDQITKDQLDEAKSINTMVAQALKKEIGDYKGILYGGFIATKDGVRVIEYNARFGDPEVMNVLPLLKTDFIDVCEAIIKGTLDKIDVVFEKKATVCKYIVPKNYPQCGEKNIKIEDDALKATESLKVFYGAVNKKKDGNFLTGSRAIACVGIGKNVNDAEQIVENAVNKVNGPIRHRSDIGTDRLIQKRIDHMKRVLDKKETYLPA